MNLPRYRSHKIVEAAKIAAAEFAADGTGRLAFEEGSHLPPLDVPADWRARFHPKRDADGFPEELGYFVRYDDGYTSWSPSKAFEDGYTAIPDGGTAPDAPAKSPSRVVLEQAIGALTTEAFGYIALALFSAPPTKHDTIFPDGRGGFTTLSQQTIAALEKAANDFVSAGGQ